MILRKVCAKLGTSSLGIIPLEEALKLREAFKSYNISLEATEKHRYKVAIDKLPDWFLTFLKKERLKIIDGRNLAVKAFNNLKPEKPLYSYGQPPRTKAEKRFICYGAGNITELGYDYTLPEIPQSLLTLPYKERVAKYRAAGLSARQARKMAKF